MYDWLSKENLVVDERHLLGDKSYIQFADIELVMMPGRDTYPLANHYIGGEYSGSIQELQKFVLDQFKISQAIKNSEIIEVTQGNSIRYADYNCNPRRILPNSSHMQWWGEGENTPKEQLIIGKAEDKPLIYRGNSLDVIIGINTPDNFLNSNDIVGALDFIAKAAGINGLFTFEHIRLVQSPLTKRYNPKDIVDRKVYDTVLIGSDKPAYIPNRLVSDYRVVISGSKIRYIPKR